jgi:hypothetical protein
MGDGPYFFIAIKPYIDGMVPRTYGRGSSVSANRRQAASIPRPKSTQIFGLALALVLRTAPVLLAVSY